MGQFDRCLDGRRGAQAFARGHPNRVARLVLVGARGQRKPDIGQWLARMQRDGWAQVRLDQSRLQFGPSAAASLLRSFAKQARAVPAYAARAILEAFRAFDPAQLHRAHQLPTLLVHGAADAIVTRDDVERLRPLYSQGELVEIGGARHLVMLERPTAFLRLTAPFLGAA